MEQPANQPSLLSLTDLTVGHTILKSSGLPSGSAKEDPVTNWALASVNQHVMLSFRHALCLFRVTVGAGVSRLQSPWLRAMHTLRKIGRSRSVSHGLHEEL